MDAPRLAVRSDIPRALSDFWEWYLDQSIDAVCLLHTRRSGANILGHHLGAAGIGASLDAFGFLTAGQPLSKNPYGYSALDPLAYLTDLVKNATRNKVLVFKVTAGELAAFDHLAHQSFGLRPRGDFRFYLPGLIYCAIDRDPLDQAVSFARAYKSGHWSPIAATERQSRDLLDFNAVATLFQERLYRRYFWERTLESFGTGGCRVRYDDIVADPAKVVASIASSLGWTGSLPPKLASIRYDDEFQAELIAAFLEAAATHRAGPAPKECWQPGLRLRRTGPA